MIPVISAPRSDGLTSFHRLGKYLTEERSSATGMLIGRGPIVISDSLLSVETAIIEMKATASLNVRVVDPILHFQISWPESELPLPVEWEQAATTSIKALGFEGHQYLVVGHNDTDNFHIHVMLNRVHPDTYQAHNPRLSQLTLHKAARELEHQFGWTEDQGLFRWDNASGKALRVEKTEMITARQNAERPRGGEVSLRGRMEQFNDQESVRTFAADKPARALRVLFNTPSPKWLQVHDLLQRYGLEISAAEKGGFAVNVVGSQIKVKASDVFRFAFSGKAARAKTDSMLGPFESLSATSPLRPPVIDYDTPRTPSRNNYAEPLRQSYAPAFRKREAPQSVNNLRSLSSFHVVHSVRVDQMLLQSASRSDIRGGKTGEHLSVRRGSGSESSALGERGKQPVAPTPKASEDRKAAWRRTMDDATRERRQDRLRERQKERQELKTEFQVERGQHRSQLQSFTTAVKSRRASLRAMYLSDKARIRQGEDPWFLKKAYLSQRTAEYLIERQNLAVETTGSRSTINRPTYEEWVEQKAESGDKRATAQLRGWRYQDKRNIRALDTELTFARTRAAGRLAGEPGLLGRRRRQELDWEILANERLRQLRDDQVVPSLSSMRWRTDAKTGDVTYTLGGKAALVDRGKQIAVLEHDSIATRVALEMAIHKFGRTIDAKGSDVFQQQLLQAAVKQNIEVLFTDPLLQARLVVARQQQHTQHRNNKHRPRPERGV